jgi:pimeloyl-ACP methyl ester carboxylesterase
MPTQLIGGIHIYYDERGSGTPLLLVHGFPLDNRIWKVQLDSLSSTCRVIAPDLRGFGQSGATGPLSLETIADDLHELMTKLKALPCVLGGLSMGGYIAQALAKRYPADLKGLILIDTKSEADTPEQKEGRVKMAELARSQGAKAVADQMFPKMIASAADAESRRPGLVKDLRQIMESCPRETIAHAVLAMKDREDYRAFLPTVKVPVLVIVGDQDVISPPAVGQAMVNSAARGQLALIRGAGHLSPMEQPEQVNQAIREWLAAVNS